MDSSETITLGGLGWTDINDLPPYEHTCALLRLDTFVKRRSIACIMFIFDVLLVEWTHQTFCRLLIWILHDIEVGFPSFFELVSIARATGFMSRCLPQCASLTRSFVWSISFWPVISLWIASGPIIRLPQDKLCITCTVVHGPSYGLTYSVDVIVASSTHCRERTYPLFVSFFILYVFVCALCLLSLSITKIVRYTAKKIPQFVWNSNKKNYI
jgi:hypothetical protein